MFSLFPRSGKAFGLKASRLACVCVDLIEKCVPDLAPSWVLSPCDFIKAGWGCSAPRGLTHPDLKEDAEQNCEWMDKTGNGWRNTFFFFLFFSVNAKVPARRWPLEFFSPGFCKHCISSWKCGEEVGGGREGSRNAFCVLFFPIKIL